MNVVLVTGGTTRLGRIISDHLRATGWRVLTSSHRPESGADIIADLTHPMGAVQLYAMALRLNNGNPPDALINNAALFTGDGDTLNQINLLSPQKLTMLMAGRETGIGSVINILDARILYDVILDDPYNHSKRALLDDTKKSAALFAETLRVNAVAPGPILAPTSIHEKAPETPLGHPTATAVAAAIAHLLAADYTTGCIIPVDGGAYLPVA